MLPELDDLKGWTSDDFVRDFDIDYTLLLENLADPDHGLFAHQVCVAHLPNPDTSARLWDFDTGTCCPRLSVDHPCSVSHDLLQTHATTTP